MKTLSLILLAVIVCCSCKKNTDNGNGGGGGTTLVVPVLTTVAVASITGTTAISGGNISADGGAAVTARGVCWGTATNPTTSLSTKTVNGSGTGTFSASITGLAAGTVYYVRSYAVNSAGTAYGNQVSFTTATVPVVPVLTTTSVSAITATAAVSGGNITADGGTSVTERGICWSTAVNPVTSLTTKTVSGSGTGTFSASLAGLAANTVYYVRSYAINSAGTAYGNQVSFTTAAATVVVGGTYGGGVVAYIFQPGDPGYVAGTQHGIIAAPTDQTIIGTGIQWWNGSNIHVVTQFVLGTGGANTDAIMATQGAGNYAASLCGNLVLNGYSDWALPSYDELAKLYQNRVAIGGLNGNSYWSSTESQYDNTGAWFFYFPSGTYELGAKSGPGYVRAVRYF